MLPDAASWLVYQEIPVILEWVKDPYLFHLALSETLVLLWNRKTLAELACLCLMHMTDTLCYHLCIVQQTQLQKFHVEEGVR